MALFSAVPGMDSIDPDADTVHQSARVSVSSEKSASQPDHSFSCFHASLTRRLSMSEPDSGAH